jgi:hypothetical protein
LWVWNSRPSHVASTWPLPAAAAVLLQDDVKYLVLHHSDFPLLYSPFFCCHIWLLPFPPEPLDLSFADVTLLIHLLLLLSSSYPHTGASPKSCFPLATFKQWDCAAWNFVGIWWWCSSLLVPKSSQSLL